MVLTPWPPLHSGDCPQPLGSLFSRDGLPLLAPFPSRAMVFPSWPLSIPCDGPHPLAPSPFGRGGTASGRRGARRYAPARAVLVRGGGDAAGILERWIHSGALRPRRSSSSRVSCAERRPRPSATRGRC